MRSAIFLLHLSKVLRLPRTSDARSYGALHLSRKVIFPKLKIWCSKMQPGNQRPDLLTARWTCLLYRACSSMNMSLVLRLPREMHLCRSSSNVPRLPWFLDMLQNPHVLPTFDKVQGTSTSKSGAYMWCFVHFDFETCFAPQRRALFRHLNF